MKMQGSLAMVWAVVATAWICGCGSTGTPKPDGGNGGDIAVEIGTGAVDFQALPPSHDLGVVKGPQGGFHFIVNAKVVAMDQPGNPDDPGDVSNPVTTFTAYAADGGVLSWDLPPYHLGYFRGVSGQLEIGGHILRLLIPSQEFILGQQVRIHVKIEQVNGRTGQNDVTVTAIKADEPDGGSDGGTDACNAPGC